MSRRSILAKRVADAAEAGPPAKAPPIDYKLECARLTQVSARQQLTIADLQLKLAKAEAAAPKPVSASKIERAEAKVEAAQRIADAADKSLARTIADTVPVPKPKKVRKVRAAKTAKKAVAPASAPQPKRARKRGG